MLCPQYIKYPGPGHKGNIRIDPDYFHWSIWRIYASCLYSSEHCGFRSPSQSGTLSTRGHRKGNIKPWALTATWLLCAPQMRAFPEVKCVLRWRCPVPLRALLRRDSALRTSAAKLLSASEGVSDSILKMGWGVSHRHHCSLFLAWLGYIFLVWKFYPNWKRLPQNSGWFLFLKKTTGN